MKKKMGEKKFLSFFKKNYSFLILILVIGFSFFSPVMQVFYQKFDIQSYKYEFENSEYNADFERLAGLMPMAFKLFDYYTPPNNLSEYSPLRDSHLYVYKSYLYIKGVISPLTVFGLYHGNLPSLLIGLSMLIFQTPHIASIVIGLVCLYSLYLLSQLLFKNRNLSFIVVGLFCLDPVFRYQLFNPLLDLYLCTFVILSFYFSFKIMENKKSRRKDYILLALSFGCAVSVKQWIGVLLILTILVYFLITRYFKAFKKTLKYLPLSFLVYGLTEWPLLVFLKRFVFSYPNLFFKIGTFIHIKLNSSSGSPFSCSFEIFKMLFTGKWKNLFANEITRIYPLPFWITFFSITSFLSVYYIIKEKKSRLYLLYLWLVIYCFIFSFKRVYPWYLTSILPIIYLLGCFTCYNLVIQIKKYRFKGV